MTGLRNAAPVRTRGARIGPFASEPGMKGFAGRSALCCALLGALLLALPVALAQPLPEIASGRTKKTAVIAQHFMVATANPQASRAAYRILRSGGSAVDAAIAAQL